jgi:hypothetical protein
VIQQKKEDLPAFLAQPLDFDTVIAYTRWKFPDRGTSEELTQILLKDINLRDYPTLQQLDTVVDRARAAVEAYQKENPDWFKTGTDFLTKSLGFVDPKFRESTALQLGRGVHLINFKVWSRDRCAGTKPSERQRRFRVESRCSGMGFDHTFRSWMPDRLCGWGLLHGLEAAHCRLNCFRHQGEGGA